MPMNCTKVYYDENPPASYVGQSSFRRDVPTKSDISNICNRRSENVGIYINRPSRQRQESIASLSQWSPDYRFPCSSLSC